MRYVIRQTGNPNMETYLSEFQPVLFSNDRAKALVFESENENQLLSMLSKYISKSKMEEWKLEVQELFVAGMVVKYFKLFCAILIYKKNRLPLRYCIEICSFLYFSSFLPAFYHTNFELL